MTGISWTDETWNPVRGCSRVSEGCRHCYAEQQAARIVRMGKGKPTAYDGLVRLVGGEARWTGEVRLVPDRLDDPMRWKKPRRIFVNSMSDLFHESLTNEQIAAVFGVMAACPQHTFQCLTKRAKRMREWFAWVASTGDPVSTCLREAFCVLDSPDDRNFYALERAAGYERPTRWSLPGVWLGVSVENQAAADERIPELLATPAAVRFLSCEPLLGAIDAIGRLDPGRCGCEVCRTTSVRCTASQHPIDWVIAGCESGHGARPCEVGWLRSLRDQCAAARVAFFLKQAAAAWQRGPDPKRQGSTTYTGRIVYPGDRSREKPGGVIELPYLDGVQHAAFPESR